MTMQRADIDRRLSPLVGRQWELAALARTLDDAIGGQGCVVGLVGPAGIGKSRVVAEAVRIAGIRGVQVVSTFCEPHTTEIACHVVTRLLRAAFGLDGLDHEHARALVRAQAHAADGTDRVIFEDALGIRDPTVDVPDIAPDARRRRLTALVKGAALTRTTPCLYVIEDAHWIDGISESVLADLLSVVPRTRSLVLITYQPEYRGALSRASGAQTIMHAPLDDSKVATLTTELLGSHPSTAGLVAQITRRAAGNPLFVEQIVHDLADREVLQGRRGAYVCSGGTTDVGMPATVQTAIAARIGRLDNAAKRTLNAAAVIGLRFREDQLGAIVGIAPLTQLIEAGLIDREMSTPRAECAFHHPLIRAVAYESQARSDRTELHLRLAAAIEVHDPESDDQNAALIAEHLEAAGAMHDAFDWHMRAATWSFNRDLRAARMSWQRARHAADLLPADNPNGITMRIAPRALLCGNALRVGVGAADTGFDELRELATAAGDKVSLAIGMAGQVSALCADARFRESSELATELIKLVESIGDPNLTAALLSAAIVPKFHLGQMTEVLRIAQRVIDLPADDSDKSNIVFESPLVIATILRASARMCLGRPGWKHDIEQAAAVCHESNPGGRAWILSYAYVVGIANGVLVPDAELLRETAETLQLAGQRGDDLALTAARYLRGSILAGSEGPQRAEGFDLLAIVRDAAVRERFTMAALPLIDIEIAREHARNGDLDVACGLLRAVVDVEFATGEMIYRGAAVAALVEVLLERGGDDDAQEAASAIERLAAVTTEPGFALYEVALLRLRALLARAHGDEQRYRNFAERHRQMATAHYPTSCTLN